MPFEIRKNSAGEYCVQTQGAGGKTHGCHSTEAEAKKQLAALYANVPEASKGEVLIHFGAAVKALPGGKVGGYLIQYGTEATKDADEEWFTPDTDFDTDFPARASIYYNHGLDPVVGRRRLGHGSMKQDELGVWVEAQLDLADRYQAAIYGMAAAGKLGWSSGSLSHITDPPREQPGGAIKSWPLGHDASLTPIPSDRRNLAVALKSWDPPPLEELAGEEGGRSSSLAENTERWLDTGTDVLTGYQAAKAGRKLSASRRTRLMEMRQMIDDLLSETAPRDGEAVEEERSAAPPPGMGEGAGEEGQSPRPVAVPALPDLNDLYTALCRQADAMPIAAGGSYQ